MASSAIIKYDNGYIRLSTTAMISSGLSSLEVYGCLVSPLTFGSFSSYHSYLWQLSGSMLLWLSPSLYLGLTIIVSATIFSHLVILILSVPLVLSFNPLLHDNYLFLIESPVLKYSLSSSSSSSSSSLLCSSTLSQHSSSFYLPASRLGSFLAFSSKDKHSHPVHSFIAFIRDLYILVAEA